MTTDIIGDLRQWNRVIQEIEQRKLSGQLDVHQDGLARLLRYRFNWRIREKAVQSVSTPSEPEQRILLLVLEIISDEHTEFDIRTLATDSLCDLIIMWQKRGQWTWELRNSVIEKLTSTMNPHHPIEFQRAAKPASDCALLNERAVGG